MHLAAAIVSACRAVRLSPSPAKSPSQHRQISPFLAGNAAWLRSFVRPSSATLNSLKLGSPSASAAVLAMSTKCLSVFLHGHSEQELRDFQANKADIYDVVQMRALASVTQEKLRKSSAGSLVTVAAILEDKARLTRGQATSINVQALVEVLDLIRQRRDEREEAGIVT